MKLVFCLIVLIPAACLLAARAGVQEWSERNRKRLRWGCQILCQIVISVTLLLGCGVAFADMSLHDETTILSGAAAFLHGAPLYPLHSSAVEYGLLYGPATYLVYVPVMMRASRLTLPLLWVVAAFGGTIAAAWWCLRRRTDPLAAQCFTMVLIAFMAPFLSGLLGIRGDVWIVFAMALGVWAAELNNKWYAAAAIALLGAFLTDLKLTLLLAALLPCASLWERGKAYRVPAVVSALLIPLLSLVPFLVHGVSLVGYEEQLTAASHHGFSRALFLRLLPFALYALLPSICLATMLRLRGRAALNTWAKSRVAYMVILVCVFALSLLTGSKNGANPWHLEVMWIPLVMLDAEMFTQIWEIKAKARVPWVQTLAVPVALGTVLLGNILIGWTRGIKARVRGPEIFVRLSMPSAERELLDIVGKYPGESFAMGYTDTKHYSVTSVRPLLQERGMPIVIDPVTRNESDLAGESMNPAVIEAISSCVVPHWILPREGAPFSMESMYYLGGSISVPQLYPDTLRQKFLAHYHRVSQGQYFALWDCNNKGIGGA